MKLLLAEDTEDMNRVITAMLNHQGYDVDSVYDGEAAYEHIMSGGYDGIILDIMMPKKDGLSVLRDIRDKNVYTPVLMLTARAEVDDRVAGLDSGADDYLTKPFAMKELLARVRSMTRRHEDYEKNDMHYGDIDLSADGFELTATNSVRLSLKEFELMQTFITNAGQELSSEFLLSQVWSRELQASEDTVYLYVSYLREKLRAVSSKAVISGERGGPYCLTGFDEL